MTRIAVLDYGMGNLHSVSRAIAKVGGAPEIVGSADDAGNADAIVVPGVGAFGACVRALRDARFDAVIREFVAGERPVLGVCLGLQVLFEGGDEDPGEPGLGLLPGRIRRLPESVKIPHMGWNEVRWTADHPLTRNIPGGTRMYFVHSYAADVNDEITAGITDYGRPFSAAIASGRLFATQFHPEKSGEPGLALYEAFVKEAA
jgi:glutamine amidotransferase